MAQVFRRFLMLNKCLRLSKGCKSPFLNTSVFITQNSRKLSLSVCVHAPRGVRSSVTIKQGIIPVPPGSELQSDSEHDIVITIPEKLDPSSLKPGFADTALHEAMRDMSATQVLQEVMRRNERMDKVDLAITMKHLYKLGRGLSPEELLEYIEFLANEPGFKVLCAMLALKGQYLEADIAADMFLFMRFLGLDSLDPAMQVYMQLLKYYINNLTLVHLVNLGHELSEMTLTPQTRVLLEGVRLACRLHQCDISTLKLTEIGWLMRLCGEDLEEETVEMIFEEIELHENILGTTSSVQILRGLSRLKEPQPELEMLCLSRIIYALQTPTKKISLKEIIRIIDSCQTLTEDYFDFSVLATNRVSKLLDCSWSEKLKFALKVQELGYYASDLIDEIIGILEDEPDIGNLTLEEKVTLVELLANHKDLCKAGDFGRNCNLISLMAAELDNLSLDEALNLCIWFTVLFKDDPGIHKIIKEVLNQPKLHEFIRNIVDDNQALLEELENMGFLHHPAIKLLLLSGFHKNTMDMKTVSLVEDLRLLILEIHHSHTSPVNAALKLSDLTRYSVQNNVPCKSGIVMDHLVRRVSDGASVGVLVLDGEGFFNNSHHLKAAPRLLLHEVLQEGHLVAVVNIDFWIEEIPDREKTRFLQRTLEELSQNSNPWILN